MAHAWFERFGLTCCKKCGIVRRADGQNSPCPGPVRIGLRTRLADRFDPNPNLIQQLIDRGRAE